MVRTRNACRGASRRVGLTVLAAVAVPTLAACSGAGSPDAEAAALPTKPPVVTPTTIAPTTSPPTTPPSTEAPTTTAAPTTTTTPLPPVTTLPPGPRNVEPIATGGPYAAVGSRSGADTAAIQQRLLDLNFWLDGADGAYGLTTKQAVMAFQKYAGLNTSGAVDQATAAALGAATEQARARADAGTMVEVDKTRQLLFFIVDGKTQWIFNTSTGNDRPYEEEDQNTPGEIIKDVAITPGGLHNVNRERPVGWWEGDLGRIYRPKYFVGGVAVHGSNSVPNYPASHGCVRVTLQAMDYIWNAGLLPMGTPVWVHGGWAG